MREDLSASVLKLGACHAAVVPVNEVSFEPEFRKMCESNACGMYGRSWMCPPYVGEVETLIQRAKSYRWVLVYQTISELEDSYDFEGMMEAGGRMNDLTQKIRTELNGEFGEDTLYLGAGGCRLCPECAKKENKPCRFPDKAMSSLEAYGINVSQLAKAAGMKYINGENTVTYFGAVFFQDE